jgi:putative RNA 2'-phosphotransferase
MARQHVHLSVDMNAAERVGKRKSSRPVVLRIDAARAYGEGVSFYQGNESVWLADDIPAGFIGVAGR